MDPITTGLIALAVGLLVYCQSKENILDAVPGPFRLPIFGNAQCNFRKLHMQFTGWAKKYGDVFRIQILSQPAIVLNSYAAVKEAYVTRGKDFIGRPQMLRFQTIGASNGVAFRQHSEKQQKMRKTAIKSIITQGSLVKLQYMVNENLTDLVTLIKAENGKSFNPKDLVKKYLINIISTMIFGEKFDYEDPILTDMIKFNDAAVEAATIGREDVDVWQWTKSVNPNYNLSVKARAEYEKTFIPLYKKYKSTYTEGHSRGLIDSYIEEVRSGQLNEEDVHGALIDYFIGGVETTASTLYGFLLILLHNPKVQSKLQSDVDEIIGFDREPALTDKKLLPYVEATILELFRYQSVLPILVPRETMVDTEVRGYKIPKGTWIYTNTWAIHHDEEVYPEPMSFKPERFIDDDCNLLSADNNVRKHILTFGMGARSCIGEQFAKNRLFLSLCSLMQNFTFVEDEQNPPPSCDARDYHLKIIFDIKDYRLKALQRF